MPTPKELVSQFYADALSVNTRVDPSAVLDRLLSPEFESINTAETKGKAVLIKQIQYFWKLIPDLRWEIQELLQDGDRVIARSLATGSPKGELMGLQLDGSRSFRMMTIDIHTVRDGRLCSVHHVEEWATAIKH